VPVHPPARPPGHGRPGRRPVDAWQGRGLASALLARLSARALEAGIAYFTAEILAENRVVLGLLPKLGNVETEASGPVVDARIEISAGEGPAELVNLLVAAARGGIIGIPAPFRRLSRVPDVFARIVRLPVSALRALLADPEVPVPDEAVPDEAGPDEAGPDEAGPDEAGPGDLPSS
jgi:hypothetical protein